MITKADCMSILVHLEDKGVDKKEINNYIKKLVVSQEIPLDVLKFISDHQGIEASNFYEMLRKSHNKKKSPLYTNILKELNTSKDILTTLSCLLVQITLYSNKLENSEAFLREIRAEEVSRVLHDYFAGGSIEPCISLLHLIKSDLLVLEYINGRRELVN